MEVFSEKVRKLGKRAKYTQKLLCVARRKSLGNRCKVVSRAEPNSRVLELAFVVRLAVEAESRRKSCNFGRFGPYRAH